MRKRINDGWRFCKLPLNSTPDEARQADWQPVDLPHDWLIWQAEDLYESADVWYQRFLDAEELSAPVCMLRFDGVYMDCDVLLNGELICSHLYGYTAFDADLSGRAAAGANEVLVHIRHRSPNTRWYSGSGIFRDVDLVSLPAAHIVPDSLYLFTKPEEDGRWSLSLQAEVAGEGTEPLHVRLYAPDGQCAAQADAVPENGLVRTVLSVRSPLLWSADSPALYVLEYALGSQVEYCRVGFRSARFDPDEGFFLNGNHLKLKGVCMHHDLGALGSAFHEKAARRQLRIMREMGANAIRTSHNPPAAKFLDLCDEMGFLVIDEAFDMWERPKTAFDYARFFPAWEEKDVASWIRRDRCHPCVILWSIGNEIYDMQADDRGREVTRMLTEQVRAHDPLEHAKVTFGSNYMPWEGAQRCAEIVQIPGYNYAEKYYAPHHAAHPSWVIYGSETASVLSSRGIYHFPIDKTIMSEADLQCSALGNSNTSWGASDLRECIVGDLNIPYSLGQFIWSGFDYIGEPTPYHTRSCYFGQTDTAGFPKDAWYLFKSLWNPERMIHIGVSWDWNPGQLIDVPVMTSCASAELFVNGVSQGRKKAVRDDPGLCLPLWRVPYAPGELKAVGYDEAGAPVLEDCRYTPGDTARLCLSCSEDRLISDGWDLAFVTISAEDAQGHPVDNARDRFTVRVSGGGYLVGLDNGDSTDTEGYKADSRRLFSGKALAMIRSNGRQEDTVVRVISLFGETALTLPCVESVPRPGISCLQRIPESEPLREIPVRKLEISLLESGELTADHRECAFTWRMSPPQREDRPIAWQVTNELGVETPNLRLSFEEPVVPRGKVTAKGDGRYYLRSLCGNAADHPEIISQLEISVTGLGNPALNPYEETSAALYDLHEGTIGAGNEKGISFARDGVSMVGFSNVDFGRDGSDRLTLPIFALDGNPYDLEMLAGEPGGPLEHFATLHYEKPSVWNVYQPETWQLPRRLTGLKSIGFRLDRKVHLKSFVFERQNRAEHWMTADDADEVYGDSFRRDGSALLDIGNNVTVQYRGLTFADAADRTLEIDGFTPLERNTVTCKWTDESGNSFVENLDFTAGEREIHAFRTRVPGGTNTLSLIFLPGSSFHLFGIRIRE